MEEPEENGRRREGKIIAGEDAVKTELIVMFITWGAGRGCAGC